MKNSLGYIIPGCQDSAVDMDAALIRYAACEPDASGNLKPIADMELVRPAYPQDQPGAPGGTVTLMTDTTPGMTSTSQTTAIEQSGNNKFDLMAWLKSNPMIVGGGLLILFLLLSKKKKK